MKMHVMLAESGGVMPSWTVTVVMGFLVLLAIGELLAIASYFATRREMDDLKARVVKVEETTQSIRKEIQDSIERQTGQQERRAVAMHMRINPLAENLSGIKGSMEAFTTGFNNFTRVMQTMVDRERNTKECPHDSDRS